MDLISSGNFLLFSAPIILFIAIIFSIFSPINKLFQIFLSGVNFLILLIAIFILIHLRITNNTAALGVYDSSSEFTKLYYKITGILGSKGGSMLVWNLFLSFFTFIFIFCSKNYSDESKKPKIEYITCYLINIIFYISVFIYNNPFSRIINYVSNSIKPDGLGLNVLLNDHMIGIHPPMLYCGYTITLIPFCIIFSNILKSTKIKFEDDGDYFLRSYCLTLSNGKIYEWSKYSWIVLLTGIISGCFWSYKELNWGGIWAWDPVENSSLLPWIMLSGYLHTARAAHKNSANVIITIFMAFLPISSFLSVILSFFTTRSGIINSMHSFAIDESNYYLKFITILIISTSLIVFIYWLIDFLIKIKGKIFKKINSFDCLIVINNFLVICAGVVILFSLIYPIFSKNKSLYFDESYFNLLIGFISILILFFAIVVIHNKKNTKFQISIKKYLKSNLILNLFILGCSTIIVYAPLSSRFFLNNFDLIVFLQVFIKFLLIYFSISLFIHNVIRSIKRSRFSNMDVAHIGFALFVFSIVLDNHYIIEIERYITINNNDNYILESIGNDLKSENKFNFKLIDINEKENNLYKEIDFKIDVLSFNRFESQLAPKVILYQNNSSLISKSDRKNKMIFGNFYLAIVDVEADKLGLRFIYRPLINLVWISTFMAICCYFLPKLFNKLLIYKNNENFQ